MCQIDAGQATVETESPTLEISRQKTEFGQARPERQHVQFIEDDNRLPQETVPWGEGP